MKQNEQQTENQPLPGAPVSGSAYKDKVIIQAFGEHWLKMNATAQRCALKHNGWVSSILEHPIPESDYSKEYGAWRPIALRNVETQNLWIVVHSKEDLPILQIPCWIETKDDVQLAYYVPHKECFGGVDSDFHYSNVKRYQKIDAPKG